MRKTHPPPLLTPFLGLALACSGAAENTASETSTDTTGSTSGTSSSTAESSDTQATDSEGDTTNTEATDTEGSAADGEPCIADVDCLSKLCLKYRDHDPQATCVAAPGEARFRLTGTILDISTGAPLSEAELRVLDGLTALQNPDGAPVLLSAVADAEGLVDTVSEAPIAAGIGLVGLVVGDGLGATTNALAVPLAHGPYGSTNTFHDLWVAPIPVLEGWSALLLPDPEAAPYLPLGTAGGVLGIVRDRSSGAALAGASVVPLEPPSSAVIRYLNAARDGFTDDDTAAHGLFVIVNPGVGERFVVEQGGVTVESALGQARDAPGSVATLVLEVP